MSFMLKDDRRNDEAGEADLSVLLYLPLTCPFYESLGRTLARMRLLPRTTVFHSLEDFQGYLGLLHRPRTLVLYYPGNDEERMYMETIGSMFTGVRFIHLSQAGLDAISVYERGAVQGSTAWFGTDGRPDGRGINLSARPNAL